MKLRLSILLTVLILFLTACTNDQDQPRGNQAAQDMLESGEYREEKVEKNEQDHTVKKEKNSDIYVVSIEEKDEKKEISAHYPEFGLTNVDQDLEKYIQHKLDIFNNLSAANEDKERASININFDKSHIKDHIYAVTFKLSSQYGPNDSLAERNIVWVNQKDDTSLLGESLFDDHLEKKNLLYDLLLKEIEKDGNLKAYLREDKLKEWIDTETVFDEVTVKDDKLIFNFKSDTIAATAAGEPSIELPLSEVEPVMPESVQNFIK